MLSKESLVIEALILTYVLVETSKATGLSIGSVDHSCYRRLLYEELRRLSHFSECLEQLEHTEAKADTDSPVEKTKHLLNVFLSLLGEALTKQLFLCLDAVSRIGDLDTSDALMLEDL